MRMPQPVFWIPIDENCNVVFDAMKKGNNMSEERESTTTIYKKNEWPPLKNYKALHEVKCITLEKLEKNPEFCFWTVQEGVLVEK